MSQAAINSHAGTCLRTCFQFSSVYLRSGISRSYGNFTFKFLRNRQTLFHFPFPPPMHRGTSVPTTLLICFFVFWQSLCFLFLPWRTPATSGLGAVHVLLPLLGIFFSRHSSRFTVPSKSLLKGPPSLSTLIKCHAYYRNALSPCPAFLFTSGAYSFPTCWMICYFFVSPLPHPGRAKIFSRSVLSPLYPSAQNSVWSLRGRHYCQK